MDIHFRIMYMRNPWPRFLTDAEEVFSEATVGQLCRALQQAAHLQTQLETDAAWTWIRYYKLSHIPISCLKNAWLTVATTHVTGRVGYMIWTSFFSRKFIWKGVRLRWNVMKMMEQSSCALCWMGSKKKATVEKVEVVVGRDIEGCLFTQHLHRCSVDVMV